MPFRAGEIHAIEDAGWAVPAGRYLVTVTAAAEKVDKNIEAWELTMKATTGHTIEDRLFWTPKAMIRGKLACEAFGVDLESDPNAEIGAANLVGKTCEVEVEERKWTGNDGKEHDGYRVTFRGYHALSPAQAATQQQASQQAKAEVRTLWPAKAVAQADG